MAKHLARAEVLAEPDEEELDEIVDEDDINYDPNEIFVDDDDDDDDGETQAIPVIDEWERGRSRMNLATDSANTVWEPITVDRIKGGDTVRAKNQFGTIIFGVVSPNVPGGYAVNIGGVGVEADGWTFERVVPPVELPDEPGWYASESVALGLNHIFLLDTNGEWHVIDQSGTIAVCDETFIAQAGDVVSLVRRNEILDAIKERVNASKLSTSSKATVFKLVEGEH